MRNQLHYRPETAAIPKAINLIQHAQANQNNTMH
jgi:hypothetical protein